MQISLPLEERRNATKLYNPMSITEIQRKFPSIPWLEYINAILAPTNKIDESERMIINTPSYLTQLERLLSTTPKRLVRRSINVSYLHVTELLYIEWWKERKKEALYTNNWTTIGNILARLGRWFADRYSLKVLVKPAVINLCISQNTMVWSKVW